MIEFNDYKEKMYKNVFYFNGPNDIVMKVMDENGKWGYADKHGKIIIPCQFDDVPGDFSEGLAAVSMNGLYGYIDEFGKVVIPFKLNCYEGTSFRNGVAVLRLKYDNGYKFGFVDREGNFFETEDRIWIPFDNHAAILDKNVGKSIQEKYIEVDQKGNIVEKTRTKNINWAKYGFVNDKGKVICPCIYDHVDSFNKMGYAKVSKYIDIENNINNMERQEALINIEGEVVLPFGKYKYISSEFNDGLCLVINNDDLYGYIDKDFNEVIPCKYQYAEVFSEGLAFVKEEKNKWIIIDSKGNNVGKCNKNYSFVGRFKEGLATAANYLVTGYVDSTGKEVIPCKYYTALDFEDGKALVNDGTCEYFINKNGENICNNKFHRINPWGIDGHYEASDIVNYIIDSNGNILSNFKLAYWSLLRKGIIIHQHFGEDHYGDYMELLDYDGNKIFDNILFCSKLVLNDKEYVLKATSESELTDKKISLLKEIKELLPKVTMEEYDEKKKELEKLNEIILNYEENIEIDNVLKKMGK